MDASVASHADRPALHSAAAVATDRTLVQIRAISGVALAGVLTFLVAAAIAGPPSNFNALGRTASRTGAAGIALATLGLAFAGTSAALAMQRIRNSAAPTERRRLARIWRFELALSETEIARTWQVLLVPLLAGASAFAAWYLRPLPSAPAPDNALAVAAALLAIAFAMLVAARMAALLSKAVLAEAREVRALLVLPVIGLPLGAAVTAAVGFDLDWAVWATEAGSVIVALIGLEVAARAAGQLFLPPPSDPATLRAPIASLLASVLAGPFEGEGFAGPLRTQLGIDFARSWALRYLRAALLPAVALTALFCWALSGVIALPIDQRAVYERLGAPVAVLHPGLHLLLPWPLGQVRRLDDGTVRELVLGEESQAPPGEMIPAEAQPPPSADRLWDQPHPGEAAFLIASETGGRQGFQIVNADVRVLWRIGPGDADALHAMYGIADPETLLRAATGLVLSRFFAVRTLDAVLGERRETIADTIRTELTRHIAPLDAGIEVLDVAIEAIHPPAGAAAAYHAVQAAAIDAQSAIAREKGRAQATLNQSAQEAYRLANATTAAAAETVQSSSADFVRFNADRRANAAGGAAFRLERYFADLAQTLPNAPLTIIDNRLDNATTGPVIDLRPLLGPPVPTDAE